MNDWERELLAPGPSFDGPDYVTSQMTARPAWHGIAEAVGLWPEVGEDQPLPFCTCGHSLATHARSGASPCQVHGCPCKSWQLSPAQTGGSDY